MTRTSYLLRRLDRRSRMMLAMIALAALVSAAGIGFVTGIHRERIERARACEESTATVMRERGWRAAPSCDPILLARVRR